MDFRERATIKSLTDPSKRPKGWRKRSLIFTFGSACHLAHTQESKKRGSEHHRS